MEGDKAGMNGMTLWNGPPPAPPQATHTTTQKSSMTSNSIHILSPMICAISVKAYRLLRVLFCTLSATLWCTGYTIVRNCRIMLRQVPIFRRELRPLTYLLVSPTTTSRRLPIILEITSPSWCITRLISCKYKSNSSCINYDEYDETAKEREWRDGDWWLEIVAKVSAPRHWVRPRTPHFLYRLSIHSATVVGERSAVILSINPFELILWTQSIHHQYTISP